MIDYKIKTREEYDYALSRGFDALYDTRFHLPIALRKSIQKERFGGNDARGNEAFYKYCLYVYPHVCENCMKPIEKASAINVSHILSRGSNPAMAHDPRNVSILCARCHSLWEHATTRDEMRMSYVEKMERRIEQLKREYNVQQD